MGFPTMGAARLKTLPMAMILGWRMTGKTTKVKPKRRSGECHA